MTKAYRSTTELHDGGLKTSSAAGQVDGVDKVVDLGTGLVVGDLIIDVAAIEVASGDEICTIGFQLSSTSDFASDIYQSQQLAIGDASPLAGDTDIGVGQYILPVHNAIGNGTLKRYCRVYYTIAGTIATGFNFTASIGLF